MPFWHVALFCFGGWSVLQSLWVRSWLRAHPEVSAEFEIASDETILVTVFNPDKTKILLKVTLTPIQLDQLLARLEGFLK